MNRIEKVRLSDIQTTEILYYDPSFETECFNFCCQRNIDFLPALNCTEEVYSICKHEKGFTRDTVDTGRVIYPTENIFSAKLLNSFRKYHLLLVCSNHGLEGVVHFSDYRKPIVSSYLYQALFEYENILRKLLKLKGYHNNDMIDYFHLELKEASKNTKKHYQQKINHFKENTDKYGRTPDFQQFYFRDLIEFINRTEIVSKLDIYKVGNLRNSVMHAHEFVHKEDPTADNLIFDFNSFETFFGRVNQLLVDFKQVKNFVALLSGLC